MKKIKELAEMALLVMDIDCYIKGSKIAEEAYKDGVKDGANFILDCAYKSFCRLNCPHRFTDEYCWHRDSGEEPCEPFKQFKNKIGYGND